MPSLIAMLVSCSLIDVEQDGACVSALLHAHLSQPPARELDEAVFCEFIEVLCRVGLFGIEKTRQEFVCCCCCFLLFFLLHSFFLSTCFSSHQSPNIVYWRMQRRLEWPSIWFLKCKMTTITTSNKLFQIKIFLNDCFITVFSSSSKTQRAALQYSFYILMILWWIH